MRLGCSGVARVLLLQENVLHRQDMAAVGKVSPAPNMYTAGYLTMPDRFLCGEGSRITTVAALRVV